MSENKWFETNKESWNKRVAPHFDSKMYDVESFKSGRSSLNDLEVGEVGNVAGKSLLHLQCHFGQDTMSWQRMGAHCTGVDISDEAIDKARQLNSELGLDCEFICTNVYDLDQHTDKQFDIIFTSYGTITWLPDLNRWAALLNRFLKPGGTFYIAEFHPMIWTLDDNYETFGYDYFNRQANLHHATGTYTDANAPIEYDSYWWNHPLSEVQSALLQQKFKLVSIAEHDYSNYDCLPGMEEFSPGKYRFKKLRNTIPYMYSMKWVKPEA
jgi:ubiquinone/menaquinone biosynthesis C-methylase UbiE